MANVKALAKQVSRLLNIPCVIMPSVIMRVVKSGFVMSSIVIVGIMRDSRQ